MSAGINIITCLIIVLANVMLLCDGQIPDNQNNNNLPRGSETVRRTVGLDPEIHRAYVNAYADENQQAAGNNPNNPWEQLAPRLPTQSEIDCFVEVVTLSRRGGRCTRLGGYLSKPFICQSGPYFEFYPTCEQIIANRNVETQTVQQEVIQQSQDQM